MKINLLLFGTICICLCQLSCTSKFVRFKSENLELINREVVSISDSDKSVALNNKKGDGIAILKNVEFVNGVIEVDMKGEDVQGRSFVGIAFNIQNDSTYEAVYFRPFNFQSDKQVRREHSIQYIYHPDNTWKYLRKNFNGQFEAEYPRRPSPIDWFDVRIKIDDQEVTVFDKETNDELLSVERLTQNVSNKIGLWTGFNSKGDFRNLSIK